MNSVLRRAKPTEVGWCAVEGGVQPVGVAILPSGRDERYDSWSMSDHLPFLRQGSRWQRWRGLGRSIAVYYGNPLKLRRMQRFYAQFIQPGDLCFDIGAHVGNRVLVWSRLGARIVAVEPQPACLALLRRLYGRSPQRYLGRPGGRGRARPADAAYQQRASLPSPRSRSRGSRPCRQARVLPGWSGRRRPASR